MNADQIIFAPNIIPCDALAIEPQLVCQARKDPILDRGGVRYHDEAEKVMAVFALRLLKKLLDLLFKILPVGGHNDAFQIPRRSDDFGIRGRGIELGLRERNGALVWKEPGRRLAVVVDEKLVFPHQIESAQREEMLDSSWIGTGRATGQPGVRTGRGAARRGGAGAVISASI